jgi:hypothetical protein
MVLLTLVVGVGGETSGAGLTGVISREFDLWPSAAALGGAAAASEDPLLALWANPAGVASGAGQVGATHSEWIADTRMEQLAVALGGGRALRLGVSSHLVTTGDIPFRPLSGGIGIPYEEPLGTFEARDFTLGVTAAYRHRSRIAFGATLRYLAQRVYTEDAASLAADLGVLWRYSSDLCFGAVLNNVGSDLDWGSGAKAPLPRSFRGGATLRLSHRVQVAADLWLIRDRSGRGAFGAEWQVAPALALRTGYTLGGDALNYSAGVGIHWRGIGFDYALIPMSRDLGTVHRVALRFVPSLAR